MTIEGDDNANHIAISDNGDGDLSVVCDGRSIWASNIHRINVDTHKGNDAVSFTQNGNRIRNMDLNAELGNGHDRFTGHVNGDVDYSRTLDINVQGEDGSDTITMYANNDVDVRAGASLDLGLYGGDAVDFIRTFYRGEADGLIRLEQSGRDGDDNLYAHVWADYGSSGGLRGYSTYDARLEGNSHNDTLQFYVYKASSDPFSVAATADGGERPWYRPGERDNDTCFRTVNVSSTGCENDTVV
jgi:hypothetical protein